MRSLPSCPHISALCWPQSKDDTLSAPCHTVPSHRARHTNLSNAHLPPRNNPGLLQTLTVVFNSAARAQGGAAVGAEPE